MKKITSFFALFLYSISLLAQQAETVEMADKMRSEGKIWVVIGVITIVFLGIITYLVMLDRKIAKLEKKK